MRARVSHRGQPPLLVQRLHSDRQVVCCFGVLGLECPLETEISGRPPALISAGDWHWCCVSSVLFVDYKPARQNSYPLEFAQTSGAHYSLGARLLQSGSQVAGYRRRRRRHSGVARQADLRRDMPRSLVRDIVGRSVPYSSTCQGNRDINGARSRRLSAGRCLRSRLGRSFRGCVSLVSWVAFSSVVVF